MSGRKAKEHRRAEATAASPVGHPAFQSGDGVISQADFDWLPCENWEIREFHPLPDGEGPPTQVHIIITPMKELGLPVKFVMRIKSKEACNAMIESLERHRNNVWSDT